MLSLERSRAIVQWPVATRGASFNCQLCCLQTDGLAHLRAGQRCIISSNIPVASATFPSQNLLLHNGLKPRAGAQARFSFRAVRRAALVGMLCTSCVRWSIMAVEWSGFVFEPGANAAASTTDSGTPRARSTAAEADPGGCRGFPGMSIGLKYCFLDCISSTT